VKIYMDHSPHIHHKKNEPQIEYVEISASTITVNGVEWKGQGIWG